MKYILLVCMFLGGCDSNLLSPTDIENLKKSCDATIASSQLEKLKHTQKVMNFNSDPDTLPEYNRNYNSLIKESIWWYAYTCNKS